MPVLLLANCQTRPPTCFSTFHPGDDLVPLGRIWRGEEGLAAARDHLAQALVQSSDDDGALERRILRTHDDKTLVFPGSLATLGMSQRRRTGFFFVLGYRPQRVRSERVIREAVEDLRARGWHARMVDVGRHRTTREDASALQDLLEKELPHVDRAVLVGFSKGGADCMEWFAGPAAGLPARERAKITLFLSFAGALRGSSVAEWIADDPGLAAHAVRGLIRLREPEGGDPVAESRSMGGDPWAGDRLKPLRTLAPHLQAVGFVAIPDGADGYPASDPRMGMLGRLAGTSRRTLGPNDGMVESAAEILPAEAGVPQRIVRVFGSHSVLDSRYADGSRVARDYRLDAKGEAHWKSGRELLDDLLRALPAHMAGW